MKNKRHKTSEKGKKLAYGIMNITLLSSVSASVDVSVLGLPSAILDTPKSSRLTLQTETTTCITLGN